VAASVPSKTHCSSATTKARRYGVESFGFISGWQLPWLGGEAAGVCCVPAIRYILTFLGIQVSYRPVASVPVREAREFQYSLELTMLIILGGAPACIERSSIQPLRSATESYSGIHVKGDCHPGRK
jgi:hypothetical protein